MKLYGIIKYKNYLDTKTGKHTFVNNLIKWTKQNVITWYKEDPIGIPSGSFICYDVKNQFNSDIFIKVTKKTIFFHLYKDNHLNYLINHIMDSSVYNLLNTYLSMNSDVIKLI